jgi:alkanesulfonate monooxygenase SsuD/methylene tetrahydromethanopterin reductase-like flavin-dependent oxidoreductase (luciferase family)
MKFGFISTEGGTFFNEALEEAIYGEELGFDSVWLEEHHSIHKIGPKGGINPGGPNDNSVGRVNFLKGTFPLQF